MWSMQLADSSRRPAMYRSLSTYRRATLAHWQAPMAASCTFSMSRPPSRICQSQMHMPVTNACGPLSMTLHPWATPTALKMTKTATSPPLTATRGSAGLCDRPLAGRHRRAPRGPNIVWDKVCPICESGPGHDDPSVPRLFSNARQYASVSLGAAASSPRRRSERS